MYLIKIKYYTSKFENNSLSINSDTPNSLIVVSAKVTPTIRWSPRIPNLTDSTIGEAEISTLENKWSSNSWIFPGEAYINNLLLLINDLENGIIIIIIIKNDKIIVHSWLISIDLLILEPKFQFSFVYLIMHHVKMCHMLNVIMCNWELYFYLQQH